jgi:hypothetical protein
MRGFLGAEVALLGAVPCSGRPSGRDPAEIGPRTESCTQKTCSTASTACPAQRQGSSNRARATISSANHAVTPAPGRVAGQRVRN